MADAPVVHIGENSPEHVAFELLRVMASTEDKQLGNWRSNGARPDRKWVLDTYSECLEAVKGNRKQPSKWPSQMAPGDVR